LDWSCKGLGGSTVTPDEVLALVNAESEASAKVAYWTLDGVVCANGVTYGAAYPVTQFILAVLPECTLPARARCLELLGQIAVGASCADAPDVTERCRAELWQASWALLHGLQFDAVNLAWLYVDLLGVLAESHRSFRPRAIQYLTLALTRQLPQRDRDMVHNTIALLQQLS